MDAHPAGMAVDAASERVDVMASQTASQGGAEEASHRSPVIAAGPSHPEQLIVVAGSIARACVTGPTASRQVSDGPNIGP